MEDLFKKYPYLRYIDGLAAGLFSKRPAASPAELETVVKTIWAEVERFAQQCGYDIFSDKMPSYFRLDVRALIMYMYEVPGASPTTDVAQLLRKEKEYGGSWKKRGGVGAFMMGCRKYDRIEFALHTHGSLEAALAADKREEGLLDDIGDLRRYLLLWESYLVQREIE